MNTIDKGELGQLKFELRSLALGHTVSKPTKPCRYDAILDTGNGLERVQIKCCSAKSKKTSAYVVNLGAGPRQKPYQIGEIDCVVVYFPNEDTLCKFPVQELANQVALYVRFEPPMNNRVVGVRMMSDYVY